MTEKKSFNSGTSARSAKTGQFVIPAFAAKHPSTTVVSKIKKSK
jgi:hypothetical protein